MISVMTLLRMLILVVITTKTVMLIMIWTLAWTVVLQ